MPVDWGKVVTSKTIWLGILTVLAGIIEYLANMPVGVSTGTVAIGILGIIIRFLTTDSLTK